MPFGSSGSGVAGVTAICKVLMLLRMQDRLEGRGSSPIRKKSGEVRDGKEGRKELQEAVEDSVTA